MKFLDDILKDIRELKTKSKALDDFRASNARLENTLADIVINGKGRSVADIQQNALEKKCSWERQ
jgi:hypothetical protein